MLTYLSTYIFDNHNLNVNEDSMMISQRQRSLLRDAFFCLEGAAEQLNAGFETDIIASTLNGFVDVIKDVVGEIPNRDVIQNIFNNFCVGK